MPRQLSATSNPSDPLTMFKAFLAIAYSIVTLFSGIFAHKMPKSWSEKSISNASHYTAGVILGTAMMNFMALSDIFFHMLRFRYPMAFLVFFVGYLVAMLVDCLLTFAVRRLPQEYFGNHRPKSSGDAIMISVVTDLKPTKYCDTAVETSKSETMDCDVVEYIRYLILFRAQLFLDYVLAIQLLCSFNAWKLFNWTWGYTNYGLESFLVCNLSQHPIRSYHGIYEVKVEPDHAFHRYSSCRACIRYGSRGRHLWWISLHNESMLGSGPSGPSGEDDGEARDVGIYMGFSAGILVYLSVHHLLRGNKPLTDTRFSKLVVVMFGIGTVSLVKFMGI